MNKTTIQIIALILIQLTILIPVTFANSIAITNVTVTDITESTAVVKWQTNTSAASRVNYGKAQLNNYSVDYNLVTQHEIFLRQLDSSSVYKFDVIASAGSDQTTNSNGGSHFQFTTKQDTPPVINTTIPVYFNGLSMFFTIKTDAESL